MRKDCDTCVHDEFGVCCKHCEWSAGKPPSEWEPCDWWTPDSNADRIRAMSDEELAKWLLDVMSHKVACFGEGEFKYSPCRNVEHDCLKCGVAWLKQPVED